MSGVYCKFANRTDVRVITAGLLVSPQLILPPWGLFRRHPLKWQEEPAAAKDKPAGNSAGGGAAKKKEKRN